MLKSLFELITIYEDHLTKRQQDSLIMKTVDYDDESSEEEISVEAVQSKDVFKKLDNQRVEINSLNSSKSSMNSPTSANVQKTSVIFEQ